MQQLPHYQKQYSRPWWQWLWLVNFFFLSCTAFLTYYPNLPLLHYLNLGGELNLAAWWSGMLLLIAALLSYEVFTKTRDRNKSAWLILACILVMLSWDEIGSLHERILQVSWSDYYPYGGVGLILLIIAFAQLFANRATRQSAFLILLGFVLFASVAVQEVLEHAFQWPYWSWGVRAAIEEGVELLGICCCLAGLVSQRQRSPGRPLITVLPKPGVLNLTAIALFFLALDMATSIWVPYLSDLPDRGNPALWYPVALYFMLFANSTHQALKLHGQKRKYHLNLALLWLCTSVVINCYKYPLESMTRFWLIHSILWGLVAIYCFRVEPRPFSGVKTLLPLCSLPFIILTSFIVRTEVSIFLMAGIFSYLLAQLFLFSSASVLLNTE